MIKALKQLFCLFLVFASVIFVASCTVTPNTPEEPGNNEDLGVKHNELTVITEIIKSVKLKYWIESIDKNGCYPRR